MGSCSSRQKQKYQKYKASTNSLQQQTIETTTLKSKASFKKQKTEFKVAPNIFVSLKKGNILSYYNVVSIIGEGQFGRVSQVVQKSTGLQRAMKQIAKEKILITQKESMIQEVSILKNLDHPHIVNIYELYEDEFSYYLITEYLKGGDLFEGIRQREKLTENLAANYMKQILNAVNYCHQQNIIHRDLKPENILFESKAADSNIKIIDFGTAKQVSGNNTRLKQKTGTPYYIAPEVINQNYNKKCDIWSCGVILYIMMCGKPPFNGSNTTKLYENIQVGKVDFSGQEWDDVSDEAKDFILKLLILDPNLRYSAEQALLDPWIVNNQRQDKINPKNLENLSIFHNKSQLGNAILQLISTQVMTSKEKQQLTEGFKAIDKNGDGKLSKQELMDCKLFKYKGYMKLYDEIKCQHMVNKIFSRADVDSSGAIDYTEFLVAYSELQNLMAQEKLQKTFKLFDKDGNGTISKGELQDIMGGLAVGEQDWSNIFGELDLNGDGEVTYEEFTEMLLKNQ